MLLIPFECYNIEISLLKRSLCLIGKSVAMKGKCTVRSAICTVITCSEHYSAAAYAVVHSYSRVPLCPPRPT